MAPGMMSQMKYYCLRSNWLSSLFMFPEDIRAHFNISSIPLFLYRVVVLHFFQVSTCIWSLKLGEVHLIISREGERDSFPSHLGSHLISLGSESIVECMCFLFKNSNFLW